MTRSKFSHTAGARGRLLAAPRSLPRRKRGFSQVLERPLQSPREIVFGIGMAPREVRTGELENIFDQSRWKIRSQQFFGDPEIHDAPIRGGKPLKNAETSEPDIIDCNSVVAPKSFRRQGAAQVSRSRAGCLLGCAPDNRGALRREQRRLFTSRRRGGEHRLGVPDFDPGCPPGLQSSLRLLVGEAGQSTQMQAVGAGSICLVELGQLSGDCSGNRQGHRFDADPYPRLKSSWAGFRHRTGFVTVGNHPVHNGRFAAVQVDENVTGVPIRDKRPEVDVVSVSIASPQKTDDGLAGQLCRRPQSASRQCLSAGVLYQPDQITLARHCCQLLANCSPRQSKSAISHKRSLALNTQKGDDFSTNGSCANSAVSHPRGTPHLSVAW
jgi:hypothetical protein